MIKIIILLIILIIIIYLIYKSVDYLDNIEYYAITLHSQERIDNMNNQMKKANIKLKLIDGVHWKMIDQDYLLKNFILSNSFYNKNDKKRDREIACYNSHLKIYNLILLSDKKYSVIFEDDFNVISDNLINDINKILKNMEDTDFDIIFLGNTFVNVGNKHKNNIYEIDKSKETVGCFAYLINNKNIKKIINTTKLIDEPIDLKMNSLIKTNNLKVYTIHPNIVNYKTEVPSIIRSE